MTAVGPALGLIEAADRRERPLRLMRVQGSAGAYLVARLLAERPGPLLWLAPTSKQADRVAGDLRTFAGSDVAVFPRYDVAPFDRFSPHPEIEARRMSLLYKLLAANDTTPLHIVAPWTAVLRRVPTRSELRSRVTHLERGMGADRDALLDILVSAGYHRTSLVEERGEVAARGGILDVFPPQLDQPVRLEFDFDSIGSLREFDPTTQRSAAELRRVVAIPPRAFRLPQDVDRLAQRARALGRAQGLPESNIYEVTEALARRRLPPGGENLEALFHDAVESVFDYLPPRTLVVIEDPESGLARVRSYLDEVFDGHAKARAQDRLVCEPLELYLGDDTAWRAAQERRPLLIDPLGASDARAEEDALAVRAEDHRELRREIVEQQGTGRALEPLTQRLERWAEQGRRVRLMCPTLSSAERLADILKDYGRELHVRAPGAAGGRAPGAAGGGAGGTGMGEPDAKGLSLEVASVAEGFELGSESLVVLTEQDIFGQRLRRRPARQGQERRGQAIDRLASLQPGDALVHTEHGIGRYGGLVQLQAAGVRQEFLLLLYKNDDKLYVPVSRLGAIQRYTGSDEQTPQIDRLGRSSTWIRTKSRVKRAVVEMAQELIAVVAARQVLEGHRYPAPDADYEEFEARFPYDDTPDQRRATEEVLKDLQSSRPMDRLVCGDVGFGKTEIACRAAYMVAAAGRQVAFLVPTTVLCQQHAQTLRQRFNGTAIEVATLSRLSTPAQLRSVREGLASGRVDIVVGTHRLLSKDIQFRNLGLLVIDEEHRFGVTHKERIKQIRKLVDVLTLSATPIPRTLQMAFTGMRDLTVIQTPPPDRVAIRSQVCRFSDEVVRDAIQRELNRGGQCFVVHNRVETIEEFASWLRQVVPHARIAVGHGQMPATQLEDVMLRFMQRECDVLLCTAIIESGLDIPNANTILIHRADHFGLAQLYQLRGRVGRSDRRAHAYFLLPAEGHLTDEARRRIEAIQDLSELGAGFRLATEDLEIRGEGNLLGPEQSGQIGSVGYDLYMEMLEQAMAELRGQPVEDALDPEIRLPVPALLPERYVEEVSQRLVLYKQLSAARDEAELREVLDDLLDRFGPLPLEARNLADVIRLKIRCRSLGIEGVDTVGDELRLRAGARTRIDPSLLVRMLGRPETPIRVTPDQCILMRIRKPEDALAEAQSLLELLTPGGGGRAPQARAGATAGKGRGEAR